MKRLEGRGSPPLALRWFMGRLLPERDRASLLGELDELYAVQLTRTGHPRARFWYAWQCGSFALRLFVDGVRQDVRALGGRGAAGTVVREPRVRVWVALESVAGAVRQGARGLRKRPSYALAAILTLGFGVAGISVVYGVAHWVLLRRVPHVQSPERLALIYAGSSQYDNNHFPLSNPDLNTIIERSALDTEVTASAAQEVHVVVSRGDAPERVMGEIVRANYFDVLGVRLAAGRGFAAEDDSPPGAVAVVSHALWKRAWAGSTSALGAQITVNGRPYTIIGVAPSRFHGAELPGRSQIWFPAGSLDGLLHESGMLQRHSSEVWSTILARLRPGATPSALYEELKQVAAAIRAENRSPLFWATHVEFKVHAGIGLPVLLQPTVKRTLALLATAASLLVLLACANVANLGLSRAASLRAETAVRRALGAGRGRIVLERIAESGLIGFAGALLATLLVLASVSWLRRSTWALLGIPFDGLRLDARVFALTLLAGVAAGLVAGVVPAWSAKRGLGVALLSAVRHGDAGAVRVRAMLVVTQVAVSLVLLVGAGLLTRTLARLRSIDLGIPAANVLRWTIEPALQGYDRERTQAYIARLLEQLETEPDVVSAGVVFSAPYASLSIPMVVMAPGGSWDADKVVTRSFQITPGFLAAAGLERIAGRNFTWQEALARDTTGPPLIILNEQAVHALFPGASPADVIGRGLDTNGRLRRPMTIVGVVRDARLVKVATGPAPYAFLPWSQGLPVGWFSVYARTRGAPLDFAERVRALSQTLDPALPVVALQPLRSEIGFLLAEPRFVASLSLVLAGLGLFLAAMGLYGVLAYAVMERTREIAVRSALGARPRGILLHVVRDGLKLAAVGTVAGLVGAFYLSRFIESRLYGVGRLDALTWTAGILLLLAFSVLSSWIPARRATRIDPMRALRLE